MLARSSNLLVAVLFAGALGCGSSSTPTPDAPLGPTFTLTINNYRAWCAITEDGAAFSPTKTFAQGAVVQVHAAPLTNFVWGYWTGTDADTGSHDTNMSAMVTMSGNKTLLACCPDPPPASQTCP